MVDTLQTAHLLPLGYDPRIAATTLSSWQMIRLAAVMYGLVALVLVAVNGENYLRKGLPEGGWAAYAFPAVLAGVFTVIAIALWLRWRAARWAALAVSVFLSLFFVYQVYALITQLPPLLRQYPDASVSAMFIGVSLGCLFAWGSLTVLLLSFRAASQSKQAGSPALNR